MTEITLGGTLFNHCTVSILSYYLSEFANIFKKKSESHPLGFHTYSNNQVFNKKRAERKKEGDLFGKILLKKLKKERGSSDVSPYCYLFFFSPFSHLLPHTPLPLPT